MTVVEVGPDPVGVVVRIPLPGGTLTWDITHLVNGAPSALGGSDVVTMVLAGITYTATKAGAVATFDLTATQCIAVRTAIAADPTDSRAARVWLDDGTRKAEWFDGSIELRT